MLSTIERKCLEAALGISNTTSICKNFEFFPRTAAIPHTYVLMLSHGLFTVRDTKDGLNFNVTPKGLAALFACGGVDLERLQIAIEAVEAPLFKHHRVIPSAQKSRLIADAYRLLGESEADLERIAGGTNNG